MRLLCTWVLLVALAGVGVLIGWTFWVGFGVLAGVLLALGLLAGWRPSRPRVRNDVTGLGILAAGVGGGLTSLAVNAVNDNDAVRLLVTVVCAGAVGLLVVLAERLTG